MTSDSGIDFGTKRIGLALAKMKLAEPLAILSNTPGVEDQIAQICQKHQISVIVLGVSEIVWLSKHMLLATCWPKKLGFP